MGAREQSTDFSNVTYDEAMRRAQGNKSQAARLLGLTRNALRYRLGQMGLETGGEGDN